MKTLLATFGDSWTYGSELEHPAQDCWTAQLSAEFTDTYNMSVPASSLGHLTVQLENLLAQINLEEFNRKVFVFGLTSPSRYLMFDNLKNEYVNVTTEAVYYTDVKPNGRPPDVAEHLLKFGYDFYRNVEHKQLRTHTASQVVAFLQAWCLQHSIQDLYMSYFEDQEFNQFVNKDKIINQGKSINLDQQYFTEGRSHPNKLGHTCIASLVKEYL